MKIFTEPSCCFLIFVLLSTDLAASNPVNSLATDVHEWSSQNCFKNEPPTTLRVIEGDSFKLTCRPLDDCLHSDIHWIKQFDDGTVESVNDSRTTVDPAGTLWFSNVTKLDASDDDFYYACAVFSPSSNEIKVGKRVVLVVDSSNEWANRTCFRDQLPETIRANEGDPFKLACQVLDDCPHAGVYWLTMDYNGGIRSIDNSRMTLDPEGNLWFSNVTKHDASDYFYYVCVVISPSGNEYKVGNRVILDVVSKNISGTNRREPVKQYVSRRTQIALRGKKVELFCIYGGSPLPMTLWSKNGWRIWPRHRVKEGHYGKSLVIKRASFEDNGVYACDVSNGVGANQTYSVELAVQSAPVFTREPRMVSAVEGETVEFACEAAGVPEPKIEWTYNGRLLAEDHPHNRTVPGRLVLTNLTKEQAGKYGCIAANTHGYVYIDVDLNVLESLAPKILRQQMDADTVDGKIVKITCGVNGGPNAEVKWTRNGQELMSGRYEVMKTTGDLQIRDVSFADAGVYTCIASNKFGSANTTSHLAVKEHTMITQRPEDYQVATGGAATFRCGAVTDSTLVLRINWLKDGVPIYIDEFWYSRFTLGDDGSLTIAEINEFDSGTYTCIASTDLDKVRAEAILVVQDVPSPPTLLSVTCGFDEATVRWAPAGDNRSPILRYSIQYNMSIAPDTWKTAKDNILASAQNYTLKLTPGSNYTFRVVAWNKIGASKPSSLSSTCSMLDEVPYKNPEDVRCEGTDPGSLTVNWTVIPKFMYRVYYKRDVPEEKWVFENIRDSRTNHSKVNVKLAYQRYKIKVVAFNERGESLEKPQEVVCVSGEDVPTQAPANFIVRKVRSNTTASLSWSKVSDETVKGEMQGYKIYVWSDKGGSKEYVVEGADKTSTLINKLVPYSKYYTKIRAYNKRFHGPFSKTINFKTSEGVPGPVKDLRACPIDSSTMKVTWNKPSEINGILTGYKVTYQEITGSYVGPEMDLIPGVRVTYTTTAYLTGLSAETKYRVTVRATTHAGEGVPYSVEETTPPEHQFTYLSSSDWSSSDSEEETTSPRRQFISSPSSDWASSYWKKMTPAPRRVYDFNSPSSDWTSKLSTRRKYNPRWNQRKSDEPSYETFGSSSMDALTQKMMIDYMLK